MQEFTAHLSFLSFLETFALIGFCFGVGCVPLIVLFGFNDLGISIVPFALIVSPIGGLIEAIVAGTIGYPVYLWISKGIGFESKGNLYVHNQGQHRANHS